MDSNIVLITGAAGFIGFHLSRRLLEKGCSVVGIDNLNTYYAVNLKNDRLAILKDFDEFTFYELDISSKDEIFRLFSNYTPNNVIHLAAQAGVRYSVENPDVFIKSNIIGFYNILEACRHYPVRHLIYASSSSVYGGNKIVPFSTDHNVDHPVSLYAATKKSNELLAHTYSHLYQIPTTGLRFFTVYGPWGRPDMAYYLFTDAIFNDRPIKLFNNGKMERDFTYIDDIIEGIIRLLPHVPKANPEWSESIDELSGSFAPYKIYNIGNSEPVQLERFISILEDIIGKKANKIYVEMQPGDVLKTYADVSDLEKTIGFRPQITLQEGLKMFVDWYKSYYKM